MLPAERRFRAENPSRSKRSAKKTGRPRLRCGKPAIRYIVPARGPDSAKPAGKSLFPGAGTAAGLPTASSQPYCFFATTSETLGSPPLKPGVVVFSFISLPETEPSYFVVNELPPMSRVPSNEKLLPSPLPLEIGVVVGGGGVSPPRANPGVVTVPVSLAPSAFRSIVTCLGGPAGAGAAPPRPKAG